MRSSQSKLGNLTGRRIGEDKQGIFIQPTKRTRKLAGRSLHRYHSSGRYEDLRVMSVGIRNRRCSAAPITVAGVEEGVPSRPIPSCPAVKVKEEMGNGEN